MQKKVLIVDDSRINREVLKTTLQGKYSVLEAKSGREALDLLSRHSEKTAAVILDIAMPDMDGYETLRLMKEDTLLAKIPVIINTASEDEKSRTKAISLGANDFLVQPYNPDIIMHCLKNNIALREVSEIVNTVQRDRLTGLYNRDAFFEKAGELLSAHEPGYYIMACLDVNSFKVINDQYGTDTGDEVLRHLGRASMDCSAVIGGICGRVAADNFVMLYPKRFAESDAIKKNHGRVMNPPCLSRPLTVSVGRYIADDLSLTPSAMYDRAVLALESIKDKLTQLIAYYDESMRYSLLHEQEIVSEMTEALKTCQFEVWLQPQYNLSTDELIGAEALVRWNHPTKGYIPPGVFIPSFEKNGFVYEVDKFVWEETCRLLRRWTDEGRNPLPVSVNISRIDLYNSDAVEVITGLVEKYDIPKNLLRLEITESAFIESTQHVAGVVQKFVNLGFTVEIDDFGSGYSSLNTLKTVPAQIVKLDMRFLENDEGTDRGGSILESIVRMLRWLGMSVIAEGVETKEQADFLKSIGCSYVQGYFFARPMPVSDYEAHCQKTAKKEHLLTLETVANLDNNRFWNPESIDSVIFNSYVGAACIWEYSGEKFELIRVTDNFVKLFNCSELTAETLLKLDFMKHFSNVESVRFADEQAMQHGDFTGEFCFIDLPGCPHETWLRSTLRIIATAGSRHLTYCLSENITAQRKAEQLERRTKEQLQVIMDSVNCGITAAVFEEGLAGYLLANDRYFEMFGYTRQQFTDELLNDMKKIIHPDDRERVMDIAQQTADTGEDRMMNFRCVCCDGSLIWVHGELSMTRFQGLEKPVQIAVLTDITEQLRLELSERKVKEQLQAVLDNINGGVSAVTMNPEGKITVLFANDMFYEMFGFTREEFERTKIDLWSLIHPDDLAKTEASVKKLMSDHIPSSYDYRCIKRGGSIIYVRCHGAVTAFEGIDGSVLISNINDITEETTNIELLRIGEETNRLAIEHSKTVVCRFNIAERTLQVSPNVNLDFQMPPSIENIPFSSVENGDISPETSNIYIDFYEKIISGEKQANAVFQRMSTTGWRWIEAHASTVFASNGQAVSSVISFVDVTESIEKERAYESKQKALQAKEQNSYLVYRFSLSRQHTSFEIIAGALEPVKMNAQTADAWELILLYAHSFVHEDYRDAYLKLLNSDRLLAAYYRGTNPDSLDYPELLPDGSFRWLRLSVELAKRPEIDEIEAYLMFENIDKAKKDELEAKRRAEKDPLTGLYNRKTFAERVQAAIAAHQPGTMSALFLINMDGFKQVNSQFGNAAGDETLIEISQKLCSVFSSKDIICRLRGDEYTVLMCGITNRSSISERAGLVCAMLHKSFSIDVQLSASIGIAVCPDDGTDFEALYKKADHALCHMKDCGKDGYALYTEDMGSEVHSERATAVLVAPLPDSGVHPVPMQRMLIVGGDDSVRKELTRIFENTFLIETAAECTAALIRLRCYGAGISIVLLDMSHHGKGSINLLNQMQESIVMQSIPVIAVSGSGENEKSLDAIHSGATDYITKPIDAEVLKNRVALALSRTENERLRAHSQYLALQNEETKRLAEARAHSEELTIALHAAEKADIAKSQFLSTMSHEIRTPLNAVIGYNTMARNEISKIYTAEERRQADMRVLDCLTKSDVASKQLLTIINDVLDMSAIESGKLKVADRPFDFKSLISSLTVMFFAQARSKGVNFDVLFGKPTEEWLCGDQMRVNQVLTNLLSNAVKFTPENGSVSLTVKEHSVNDKSTTFQFIVSDTGIGMTKEYLEHIWSPFEQAESSISRRFGGTGLGLSITKNLVTLMNGTISVESESGVGSTFTVELTFRRTKQPKKPVDHDFSNVNALVVDDDVSTCDYIKLLFDRCGAKCLAMTSGEQAIEAFSASKDSNKPFNLCLVDWKMPNLGGFETIAAIRRIAAKDLPIIVVTAYDFSDVEPQAEALGISRFVSKPLFQSSLFDLLANFSGNTAETISNDTRRYDFGGARVLLAEDNSMNMEIAKRILSTANLAVDSAWNGQDAIDIFEASSSGTYKAIFMDIHMPVTDGYEATRILRSSNHPDAKKVPIIAMTADAFAEDVSEALKAGMNGHIAKPIDIQSLFVMLAKYIDKKD